ncbi:MAG TPA: hypothetical protein PLU38_07705 [Kiritimatiellia bacterium]|nr:hypothetical protein [Kiritimatiellia bacterium]HQQ91732.1 hypothetical protein [Kiritimatiellia bacterium]
MKKKVSGVAVCPLAALVWVCMGLAQTAEGPRLPRGAAPAAPVYSRDGTVVVYAPGDKAGYRMPVLTFVTQFSAELQRVLRLKLGSQLAPLEVAIGGQSDGDTRVLTVRLRDAGGGVVRERIELPDPEAADLDLFRRAVCVALLRGWMAEAGGTEATMQDVPGWLIDGLLRYIDRERRQADVDRTLLLWSRACLPPAAALLEADSLAATREPAVAAVLASWLMERRDGVSHLERLLRAAATGTPWSVGQAARLLAGGDDAAAFDAHVDRRLLAESRVVARPGLTTAGIVRRFRAHLLLYPAFYDKNLSDTHPWCTLQQAVVRAQDPAVRAAAAAQGVRMKIAAVGRDGMLLAVSEAYSTFFGALARGAKQGELTRLLLEAEGMRRTLERRVAQGEVFQRDAGSEVQGDGAQRK